MKNQLNILIDARMVSAQNHGIARYTVGLIQELSKMGNKISILSASPETLASVGPSYVHDVISVRSPFVSIFEPLELAYKTRRKKFDIVHFPSFAVPLAVPENSVVTIHDMIHFHGSAKLRNKVYYKMVVKRALDHCRQVIAVSQWTKGEINHFLGTPLEKINVVRNGIDESWFEAKDTSAQARPYFLCLSNPKPHKNVLTLINACRKLWYQQGRDFQLVLSLGGYDFPTQWKITPAERERIELLNNVADESLKIYLRGALALVSPSLLEGYDYPAAEALALGRRAVISSGSAHDELSGDLLEFYGPGENTGALTDTLLKILDNQDITGSRTHNIHSRKQMALDTFKVYEDILRHS